MHASEKSGYVSTARKIKEQFHVDHPDAKTRCVSRKGKRKADGGGGGGRGVAQRSVAPPSLHALALVGSRLNQTSHNPADSSSPYQRSTTTWSSAGRDDDDDDDDDDDEYDYGQDESELTGGVTTQGPSTSTSAMSGAASSLTLLEQLCTVAENEHTAAAHALSAFGAC